MDDHRTTEGEQPLSNKKETWHPYTGHHVTCTQRIKKTKQTPRKPLYSTIQHHTVVLHGKINKNICNLIWVTRGLISLWLYKENNKLQDLKKCIHSTYSPLSSTHLWLRCSNFFNPSKKNSFGSAANRKSQRLISTPTYNVFHFKINIQIQRNTGIVTKFILIINNMDPH
jgi:hypothetical protein